jgi:hypothetical protein
MEAIYDIGCQVCGRRVHRPTQLALGVCFKCLPGLAEYEESKHSGFGMTYVNERYERAKEAKDYWGIVKKV